MGASGPMLFVDHSTIQWHFFFEKNTNPFYKSFYAISGVGMLKKWISR